MPRSATGEWLDSIPFGRATVGREDAAPVPEWKFAYNPVMFEGPWYTPWWSMFFYEASSWEYSLSMPHDVEGLIEMCGGKEAFEKRLDTFFDNGHYNVNNEPSFLTPCLYHWIGRPRPHGRPCARDCFGQFQRHSARPPPATTIPAPCRRGLQCT